MTDSTTKDEHAMRAQLMAEGHEAWSDRKLTNADRAAIRSVLDDRDLLLAACSAFLQAWDGAKRGLYLDKHAKAIRDAIAKAEGRAGQPCA